MTTVRRVKGWPAFRRAFRKDMGALRDNILEAVHRTASEGADVAIQTVPVAFGELVATIRDIPHESGATIRADAPHAAAVEVGSRPHKVSIWALKRWCEVKGIPTSAAWPIQVKIAREGTRPTWFMRRTLPAVERLLHTNMRRALARDLPG